MATPTYDLLDSVTLSSSASSVTFSSISQDYRDLILVMDAIPTATYGPAMQFNSDTGYNYFYVLMEGNGSTTRSAASYNNKIFLHAFTQPISGQIASAVINIMDYSATDKHKPVLMRVNAPDVQTLAWANRWANTSAVTQIELYELNGNGYPSGATFYLYGVAA